MMWFIILVVPNVVLRAMIWTNNVLEIQMKCNLYFNMDDGRTLGLTNDRKVRNTLCRKQRALQCFLALLEVSTLRQNNRLLKVRAKFANILCKMFSTTILLSPTVQFEIDGQITSTFFLCQTIDLFQSSKVCSFSSITAVVTT